MNYAADFCEILKDSRRKALFGVFFRPGTIYLLRAYKRPVWEKGGSNILSWGLVCNSKLEQLEKMAVGRLTTIVGIYSIW
jgi:hypothetical protein